jgi:hypothetical protein
MSLTLNRLSAVALLFFASVSSWANQNTITANTRVYEAKQGTGTVLEVYADGTARVQFDIHAGDSFLSVKSLSIAVTCIDDVCANSRVHDSTLGGGTVREVFSNHIARVDYDIAAGSLFVGTQSLSGHVAKSAINQSNVSQRPDEAIVDTPAAPRSSRSGSAGGF